MQLVNLTLWGKIGLDRPEITFFFLVHTAF